MTDTKHTLGPWEYDGHRKIISIHRSKKYQQIAEVGTPGISLALIDGANARLITAAPELLEALKELEALRKTPHPSGDLNAAVAYRQRERDAVALSKAAIAKAEGKPDEAV